MTIYLVKRCIDYGESHIIAAKDSLEKAEKYVQEIIDKETGRPWIKGKGLDWQRYNYYFIQIEEIELD